MLQKIKKQNFQDFEKQQHEISAISLSTSPNDAKMQQTFYKQLPNNPHGYRLIIAFIILGFYFLSFGIVQLSTNFNETKYQIKLNRFGNDFISPNTLISFKQNSSVFIYLEVQDLTQFDLSFQNEYQRQSCKIYRTNQQLKKTKSITGVPLAPQNQAIPCGRQAALFPEGQFEIIDIKDHTKLKIQTNDISLDQDHIPTEDFAPDLQWATFKNERLRNWLSMNSQQTIKKLWGRIPGLVSGEYQIKLTVNNELSLNRFYVSLCNNQALSGFNNELCYLNFFYAALAFSAALANFLIQKKWGYQKILKTKSVLTGKSNQIKIFLNSDLTSPRVKNE